MAAAERRRGRRDNGLDATDWRALEDLDPRVSEHVLDLLAVQGIAAYVQPAVDVDPLTRSATLPNPPRDRLYVDRQHLSAAKDSLRRFLQASGGQAVSERAPVDVDTAFADIVAHLDDPAAVDEVAQEPQPTGPVDGRHVTEPSLLDALDTFGADLPDEEPQEKFVPPPPPPLPRMSGQTLLGSLAVVAGLVMVVVRPDFLPLDGSSTMLLGFATMLGGATVLITRLRPGTDPEEESHPDDGAQV